MSDRSSAYLFSMLFEMFAEEDTEQAKEYARRVWVMSWQYDFDFVQMGCNEALERLGLSKSRPSDDPDDPYPTHDYADEEGHLP